MKLALGLKAEKSETDPLVLLGATGGPGLTAKSVGGSIGVDASLDSAGGSVTPTVELRVNQAKLNLNSSAADGFVQDILSGRSADVGFDIVADWNARDGLLVRGNVGGETFIPAHVDLSVARIDGIYLSIGVQDDAALAIGVKTQITANVGPVVAVLDRVGIAGALSFPQSGGNLGPADLDIGFKPPSGIGLSVDAHGVLSGGGFLFHDEAQQLYAGVMQLSLHEQITLKAFGLIATRMPDGSRGYSLIVFITAEDFRPIPLGLGFTLLGIGGMVAINRTFDRTCCARA